MNDVNMWYRYYVYQSYQENPLTKPCFDCSEIMKGRFGDSKMGANFDLLMMHRLLSSYLGMNSLTMCLMMMVVMFGEER